MIHSKEKEPDEVMAFMAAFKREHPDVPVVLVPTSYNDVPEQTLCDAGASVIIHANHFIRSAYPAMVKTARSILEHGCSAQASLHRERPECTHMIPAEDKMKAILPYMVKRETKIRKAGKK